MIVGLAPAIMSYCADELQAKFIFTPFQTALASFDNRPFITYLAGDKGTLQSQNLHLVLRCFFKTV
jgi:hypothetical protein